MKKVILFVVIIAACASAALAQTSSPAATQSKAATPAVADKSPQQTAAATAEVAEDCGCEVRDATDVLAVVNGVKVSNNEIEEQTRESVGGIKRQVIEARKHEVDLQINTRLLNAEAKRRGLTPVKLVEAEVISKVAEPTDSEAQSFFEQNKNRIVGEFADVKKNIIEHLRVQRQGEEAKKFVERLRAGAQVKVLVERATPPQTEMDRARVFATVNGDQVTSGDVENQLRPLVSEAQRRIYNLRKKELDQKINSILLEAEAQKRKVTTQAILDAELKPKVRKVTEDDAVKYYEQNKEKMTGDFTLLRPQIMDFLQQREVAKAEVAFADQLRSSASIQIFLAEPPAPEGTGKIEKTARSK
ncbi:MAG: hypothetical protein LC754_10180 [Acidobacteria bacterium]|nr:hypothetical protein [Acidobacteriota bacterium]